MLLRDVLSYQLGMEELFEEGVFDKKDTATSMEEISVIPRGLFGRHSSRYTFGQWMYRMEKFAQDFGEPLEFNTEYFAAARSEIELREQHCKENQRDFGDQWVISKRPVTLNSYPALTASETPRAR